MRRRKTKSTIIVFLAAGWLLTLGIQVTSSWTIYQVIGQDPNNWKPSNKPHLSYLITPNEKVIGIPLLLTYQYDQALADFRFYVATNDSSISEVVIQSLDIQYGSSKPERIIENQICRFENLMTAGPMRANTSGKNFEFSFIAPKSIRTSSKMNVRIEYSFKKSSGELEEFAIENERQYRKGTEVRTNWMNFFEGVGAGIGGA